MAEEWTNERAADEPAADAAGNDGQCCRFLGGDLFRGFGGSVCGGGRTVNGSLKIVDLELIEVQGRYETEDGVNGQPQVNPLDIYDELHAGT